jgi:hypothetical protein
MFCPDEPSALPKESPSKKTGKLGSERLQPQAEVSGPLAPSVQLGEEVQCGACVHVAHILRTTLGVAEILGALAAGVSGGILSVVLNFHDFFLHFLVGGQADFLFYFASVVAL